MQNFPWTESAFRVRLKKAVAAYWNKRGRQARRQKKGGKKDAGSRGEVTGGQHLNGFAELLIEVIKAAGVNSDAIYFHEPLVLPGYYRPQKKWDIVVCEGKRLHVAIELKSQSNSFGNNLNNRAEEVLGLAKDFWTSYREKAFGVLPQPWVGYLFLLEDAPKSRRCVKLATSSFNALPIFEGTSYMDRYGILCERLVLERDYTATALLASPRGSKKGEYTEPRTDLSVYQFALSLYQHLLARQNMP